MSERTHLKELLQYETLLHPHTPLNWNLYGGNAVGVMKKTGFKKLTYSEALAKKVAKGATTTKKAPKRKIKRSRPLLPSSKTMRNKCDGLLTPIVKKMYPQCLLCNNPTQVAHHHLKKSTSSACRYYIPNLINLCTPCHCRLHNDEILWTGRVIQIKGLDWLNDLEEKKREYVKTDVHFYIENYERLSKLLT